MHARLLSLSLPPYLLTIMADPLIGFTMDLSDIQDMRSRGSAATGTDSDQVARGGLGSQCLPIAELDQDWNGEPQDGMEYLFTVRYCHSTLVS